MFWFNSISKLESVIIPILFPNGKGECMMFTKMFVLRKYFCRAGILNAAAMVFAIENASTDLTELAVKRNGAMAIQ